MFEARSRIFPFLQFTRRLRYAVLCCVSYLVGVLTLSKEVRTPRKPSLKECKLQCEALRYKTIRVEFGPQEGEFRFLVLG
jgi:hypothetical protein